MRRHFDTLTEHEALIEMGNALARHAGRLGPGVYAVTLAEEIEQIQRALERTDPREIRRFVDIERRLAELEAQHAQLLEAHGHALRINSELIEITRALQQPWWRRRRAVAETLEALPS